MPQSKGVGKMAGSKETGEQYSGRLGTLKRAKQRDGSVHRSTLPSLVVLRFKELAELFFVAVQVVDGRDGAEEAVIFAVDAGGKEESVGRTCGSVISKGQ